MAIYDETEIPIRRQFSLATLFLLVTAAATTLGLQAALPSFEDLEEVALGAPDVDIPWGLVVLVGLANLACIVFLPLVVAVGTLRAPRRSLFLACYAGAVFFAASIALLATFEAPSISNSLPVLRTTYAAMLVFAAFALGEAYIKGLGLGFKLASLAGIWAWLAVPLHVLMTAGMPDK